MPCRSDGYGDPLGDIVGARDKAAAVACECIKAMLLNDGYDLHDLPAGAETWFREHRERDKVEAVRLAEVKLRQAKQEPAVLVEDKQLRARGYMPDPKKRAYLERVERERLIQIRTAESDLQRLKASDPMDLKHGLY